MRVHAACMNGFSFVQNELKHYIPRVVSVKETLTHQPFPKDRVEVVWNIHTGSWPSFRDDNMYYRSASGRLDLFKNGKEPFELAGFSRHPALEDQNSPQTSMKLWTFVRCGTASN